MSSSGINSNQPEQIDEELLSNIQDSDLKMNSEDSDLQIHSFPNMKYLHNSKNITNNKITNSIHQFNESYSQIQHLADTSNEENIQVNEIQSSIFSQIAQISEYLAMAEEKSFNKKADPCLSMLSEFFDIFNEQLRINFKIRNILNSEKKRHPIDSKQVDLKKAQIDRFLKKFDEIISQESNSDHSSFIDSNNLEKSFNNIITIIQKGVDNTNKLKDLTRKIELKRKEVDTLNEETETTQRCLSQMTEVSQQQIKTVDGQIEEIQGRVSKIQNQVGEFTTKINDLRIQVQNDSTTRQNLTEMISARKKQIEKAKMTFFEEEKKQKKKQMKLAAKLSKLKAEKKQLMIDEQPLMKALEEGEKELQETKKVTDSEMESITTKREAIKRDIDAMEQQRNEFLMKKAEIENQYLKKKQEVNDNSIKFQETSENIKQLKLKITKLDQIRAKIISKLHLNGNENDEFSSNELNQNDMILTALSDEIKKLEQTAKDNTDHIEQMRKENAQIRSKIRVNTDQIHQYIEENKKLAMTVDMAKKEVDKMTFDAMNQTKRYETYKSTLSEYERLRESLGFHNTMDPIEVAKHAISMVKSWKQIDQEEERRDVLNDEVSFGSIKEDFKIISDELNQVELRLNTTTS